MEVSIYFLIIFLLICVSQVKGASNCTSEDPDYDFQLTFSSGYTFYWSLVDDTILDAQIIYEDNVWVAWALSEDDKMIESDAVIAFSTDSGQLTTPGLLFFQLFDLVIL